MPDGRVQAEQVIDFGLARATPLKWCQPLSYTRKLLGNVRQYLFQSITFWLVRGPGTRLAD
jgi:hypothetical protein